MFERMKAEKEEGRGRDVSNTVEPVATVTGVASVSTITTTTATTATPDGSISTKKTTSQTGTDNEETAAKNKLARLSVRLRRLNSYSSLLNVLTLMALTWHLVHLAILMCCCE